MGDDYSKREYKKCLGTIEMEVEEKHRGQVLA